MGGFGVTDAASEGVCTVAMKTQTANSPHREGELVTILRGHTACDRTKEKRPRRRSNSQGEAR